jgi:hypothetical protein
MVMTPQYAYSLSGDQYRGPFVTREEALAAAIDAARHSSDSPQTVFVGRMVPADAKPAPAKNSATPPLST